MTNKLPLEILMATPRTGQPRLLVTLDPCDQGIAKITSIGRFCASRLKCHKLAQYSVTKLGLRKSMPRGFS